MSNLSCADGPIDEGYSFYEHIENYLHYKNICIRNNECNQYDNICIFDEWTVDDEVDKLTLICKRFLYLLDKLITSSNNTTDNNENAHLEYLNYWLNNEQRVIKTTLEPNQLFKHIRSKSINNGKLSKLIGNIKNIPQEEINNMYSLFYLYEDYINIKNSITGDNPSEAQFQHYTKHCVKKYQELEGICLKVRTSFCKALCDFRKKYESINLTDDIKNDWSYNSLPPLSKNEQIVEKVTQSPSHGDSSTLLQGSCRESEGGNVLTPCNKSDTGNESLIITDVTPALLPVDSVELSETPKIVSTHPVQRGSESIGATTVTSDINSQKYVENTEQIEIKNEDGFDIHKNKIIGTSVSTLGVSSLFFLFYKFTSLGSRFRSKNKSKKYMGNNFDEQSNNFLDTSEYQYLPEESMSYNISYNSV
ncbi:VIR protein [Plasmodium vivax]|uniref:VIR protein n=1 Tax=Plasmodium vivax TaxID=5855 RepID=A0A1G4EBU6_PLAVI|nr:VIR protein [Plasmodium vivax]